MTFYIFTEDIITRHSSRSTGVNNNINDGRISFCHAAFRVLVLCMLAHCHMVTVNRTEQWLMLLVTPMFFQVKMSSLKKAYGCTLRYGVIMSPSADAQLFMSPLPSQGMLLLHSLALSVTFSSAGDREILTGSPGSSIGFYLPITFPLSLLLSSPTWLAHV